MSREVEAALDFIDEDEHYITGTLRRKKDRFLPQGAYNLGRQQRKANREMDKQRKNTGLCCLYLCLFTGGYGDKGIVPKACEKGWA